MDQTIKAIESVINKAAQTNSVKKTELLKGYTNRLINELVWQSRRNDRLITEVVLEKVWDYETVIAVLKLQGDLSFNLASIIKEKNRVF